MAPAARDFQIFVKPGGAACGLACGYCYYRSREGLYSGDVPAKMPDEVLESYIRQHIEAAPSETISFSWHGGEPTILGLGFFQRAVALQKKYRPPGRRLVNGIQTNGMHLNESWVRFFRDEGFCVGLSLDGPAKFHDFHRRDKSGGPTHDRARRGFELLQQHGVRTDILCVVHAVSVRRPERVYRYLKRLGASRISFLPLVERRPDRPGGVGPDSVPPEAFGEFLGVIFDEWTQRDIGRVQVEVFEEAARVALGLEPTVCVLRRTCGDVPVIERNGDFYSCDHFVTPEHKVGDIRTTRLSELLDSPAQLAFGRAKFATLPQYCRDCEVLASCNGGCPKDRFIAAPDGEPGLNYLCAGYKKFLTHCRPFLTELAALRRAREKPFPQTAGARTGRNDPCPCGSGKKFKKCCGGR
ncbi:MAG: anaerobic sulfatase maturase [Pseudomonadota bacterium]